MTDKVKMALGDDNEKDAEELRRLTGPQKAAILMLALGEEYAPILLGMMDEVEIKELSHHMAALGKVQSSTVEALLKNFADSIFQEGDLYGTIETTEKLLAKIFGPEKVAEVLEDLKGPAGRTMWDKLSNVNESLLANYLRNEHPQTVAVILSKIDHNHASNVLSEFPEEFSMEVIWRLLYMGSVQPEVLDNVARTLRHEFMTNVARTQRFNPYQVLAEIFNFMEKEKEAKFLGTLEQNDQPAAEKIRSLMFTFEDLRGLDPKSIQVLLKECDKRVLTMALKGTGEDFQKVFLNQMAERAGRMFKDEIEALGAVRLREVETAQMEVVALARRLSNQGEIALIDKKGSNELVY